MPTRLVSLIAILLSGCAMTMAPAGPAPRSSPALPTGATSSAEGYLTSHEAPPSPFPAHAPPEPQIVDEFARRTSSPDEAVRARAWEEANGSPAFQTELQRLRQVLAREQPDNFVEIRIVRDPAVAAEIWFKRDAASTLARYTSDPMFRPREGGATLAEQARLRSIWTERMAGEGAINMVAVDAIGGVVEVGLAIEEAEFRRMAEEKGWELGPHVKLLLPPPRPSAFIDPALSRHVRAFARESNAPGIQLLAGYSGRIILQDGCFRLESGAESDPGPLVLFGRQARLGLDEQKYLTVFDGAGERRYRVGEIGSWPGPNGVDEEDPEVRELRRQCGGGPIVNVAEPQSLRLFGLPDPQWVADYARARALSYGEAWQVVIACIRREERRGRTGIEARDRCIRQFN